MIQDRVVDYLDSLAIERGLSQHTVAAYTNDLSQYLSYLGDNPPTAELVEGFIETLADLAPATVARKIASVRGFHRFLVAEEITTDDPTTLIETPRRGAPLPKALAVEEVLKLLDACDLTTPLGRRNKAILEFLYATGARVTELVDLSLHDLDLVDASALVTGKGDKQRIVPLGLAVWLEDRLAFRRSETDDGAVFLNRRGGRLTRQAIWSIVRAAGVRAGIEAERLSPHVLRHSAATHMVEGGADLRTVQEMLGHASISTTQVYTRVSPRHLYEIYVEAHPRSR